MTNEKNENINAKHIHVKGHTASTLQSTICIFVRYIL